MQLLRLTPVKRPVGVADFILEVEDSQSSDARLRDAWCEEETRNRRPRRHEAAVRRPLAKDGQGLRRASERTPNRKPSASPLVCFSLGVSSTDGPPPAGPVVSPSFHPLSRTSDLADLQDRGRWVACSTDFLRWWPPLSIFEPPPHSIRSLDNRFRFRVHPNFCLAIYKPDGRHTAERILFYRVTPIWDIFRQTMDLLFIVVHFFCHVDKYAVHLSHLATASHLSSNPVGTLERQRVRDALRT